MSNIFIPEKIRVGYQNRQDTYTGRLAYVVYFGKDGKLKKEVSWNGWRDESIPFDDFDNTPIEGIVLNKDVQRCNWSYFGSGRSYIRIYDPRGIEFEITPENLINILMETNCNHRALDGKFVYAWAGKELLLLPCGSETYQEATKNTALVTSKFSARDLKVGCSYTTKKSDEWIYMGRMPWTTWDSSPSWYRDEDRKPPVQVKRQHVFWNPGSKAFIGVDGATSIAHQNSDECVPNYAELADWLDLTPAKVGNLPIECEPTEWRLKMPAENEGGWKADVTHFFKVQDGILYRLTARFEPIRVIADLIDQLKTYAAHYGRSYYGDRPFVDKAKTLDLTKYRGAVLITVDCHSPIAGVEVTTSRQFDPSVLAILGMESEWFAPLDPEEFQREKQAFFGDVVKPYIQMPGGARKKVDWLSMPDPNKPWIIRLPKSASKEVTPVQPVQPFGN